jgi:hypothetical protein
MVYAGDLKSTDRKVVPVRVREGLPLQFARLFATRRGQRRDQNAPDTVTNVDPGPGRTSSTVRLPLDPMVVLLLGCEIR